MEQYLTINDIVLTLGITRQTVSKLIHEERLPSVRINKQYRIFLQDFYTFLSNNTTNPNLQKQYNNKAKNCSLLYHGKSKSEDILSNRPEISIIKKLNNHSNAYNSFYFGNNFEIMLFLLSDLKNKIDLIYIDPPFGTGQLVKDIDNNFAYSDETINHDFLNFLRNRLIVMKELLSEQGSIYLHIDKKIGHYVKIIMDEIFGSQNFLNDITRIKCNPKNFSRKAYGNYSDMILFYAKRKDNNIWNNVKEKLHEEKVMSLFPKIHPELGRYTTHPLHAPGETKNGDTGQKWKGCLPPKGRHWRNNPKVLTQLDEKGLIEWSENNNPRKIVFFKDHQGCKTQDVWEFKDKGLSYVDYPTQKNYDLLERIILNSSNKDSIVLDCFAGSGTTLKAAYNLRRKWIGIDNSKISLKIIQKWINQNRISGNIFSNADKHNIN